MHAALLSLTALGAATAVTAGYAPSYVACDGSASLRLAGTPAGGELQRMHSDKQLWTNL